MRFDLTCRLHQDSRRGTAECGILLIFSSTLSSTPRSTLSSASKMTLSTLALLDVKIVVAFQSISFSGEIVTVDRAEIKSEILMLNVALLSSSPEPSGSL